MQLPSKFLSCDWGTTHFRLRWVDARDGRVISESASGEGVKSLRARWMSEGEPKDCAARFEDFLVARIASMHPDSTISDDCQVVISGMASSSVGWIELPYAQMPFSLDGSSLITRSLKLNVPHGGGKVEVLLLSGLANEKGMMRGEETEMIGLWPDAVSLCGNCETVVILPGTHSKHVKVREGRIVDLRTYMTGELFEILTRHSILSASVGDHIQAADLAEPEAMEGFLAGVDQVKRQGLPQSLFEVRSRQVLHSCTARSNRWYLSGLLIGAEMLELRSFENDPVSILLHAGEPQRTAYLLAGRRLGLQDRVRSTDGILQGCAVPRAHSGILKRHLMRGLIL